MRWSYSAHMAMRRCQLQLVFGQVLAHHAARDPVRKEAYRLRQLQSLSTWQGNIVHKVLATHLLEDLQQRREVSAQRLTQAAQELARRQFAFSAAHRYRAPDVTKSGAGDDYLALFEHENNLEVTQEALGRVYWNLAICFENLVSWSDFIHELQSGYQHRAELPLRFRLDGKPVEAKPDLVLLRSDHALTVVDWKIAQGEASDYSRQLELYALAVARCGHWRDLDPDRILLYEANLLKNRITPHYLGPQWVEEAEDFVYRSLVDMESLIGDVTADDVDLDDYEVADLPGTCAICNFQPLCARSLSGLGLMERVAVVQGSLF